MCIEKTRIVWHIFSVSVLVFLVHQSDGCLVCVYNRECNFIDCCDENKGSKGDCVHVSLLRQRRCSASFSDAKASEDLTIR